MNKRKGTIESVVFLIMALFIASMIAIVSYDAGCKSLRAEAVKVGTAEWTSDKDGYASFSWILHKEK